MRLSTKSRFAVTAMIDIALRENAGPVSLTDIGSRHQISVSYLEQLFSKLRQYNLVQSTRGPGGGYALARASASISVADIIGAVEPDAAPAEPAAGKASPANHGPGMTQELWATLSNRMVEHMQSISLHYLACEQRAKGVRIEARPSKRGIYTAPRPKPSTSSVPNSVFALGSQFLAKG